MKFIFGEQRVQRDVDRARERVRADWTEGPRVKGRAEPNKARGILRCLVSACLLGLPVG